MTSKISKEFDLNIKTDNFIKDLDSEDMQNQVEEIQRKFEVSSTGIRQLEDKKRKIDIQNEKEAFDPNQLL